MEFVHCEAEYNPESIMNYYSCGVQPGRIKNPDVKNMLSKAKNHLAALGWSFFYITKRPGKRELRYRSPAGKIYVSLRSACQGLIEEKKPKKNNRFSKVGRPKKRVYSHDLELGCPRFEEILEQETKLVKKDEFSTIKILGFQETEKKFEEKDEVGFGSSKIEEGFNEFGTIVEKYNEVWSDNLPEKRIRVEGLEYLCFNKDSSIEGNEKEGFVSDDQPRKRIRDMKRLMEVGNERTKFKLPNKRIRKVDQGSFTRRRCVLSLLIEKNIVTRGANVCYRKKDGKVIAKGRVYDDGIQCDCCGVFFLLSKFEAHAGSTYHRPAAYIFLEDGRSLCDCQNQLKLDNDLFEVPRSQELYEDPVFKGPKSPESTDRVIGNDEYCWICKDGGDLILCDSCTSSYHPTCVGLNGIPDSNYWYCPFCSCGICDRVRIGNFTNVASNAHSQIKCGQCEHKFHIECIRNLGFSISSYSTNWFCKEQCERIYIGLRGILGTSIPLSVINNLTWRLLKLDYEKDLDECRETYDKLNAALDIMHECFQIENHPLSEHDIIEDVIFSRYTKRSNFTGFFTAVLEKDQKIITVVNIRVHGCRVAEIPLVATRFKFRRQGMCRILIEELERKLGELGVERLVLPAIPEMANTWTESFGFNVMTQAECMKVADCKFLEFPGSIKCHKILKKW